MSGEVGVGLSLLPVPYLLVGSSNRGSSNSSGCSSNRGSSNSSG